MKKIVLIINGTGGCGKDTFVSFASKYAKVTNFSSIDKVKEIAKLIGWTGTKSEKDRKFLSDLKKLTTEYNEMAFTETKKAISEFLASDNEVMFIHIREKEEIEKTIKECEKLNVEVKTILIRREGLDIIETNSSDKNVEDFNYDETITNTSLDKLDESAKTLIKKFNRL